jgi:hypothetical protein
MMGVKGDDIKLKKEDKTWADEKAKMVSDERDKLNKYRTDHLGEPFKTYHATVAKNIYNILFEGLRPQVFHNFSERFYKGDRVNRVFVTNSKGVAEAFAWSAKQKATELGTPSPSIILEVEIPAQKLGNLEVDVMGGGGTYMMPEIKPEWIKNVYDEKWNDMAETINSLSLQSFDPVKLHQKVGQKRWEELQNKPESFYKAGKLYIPVSLGVLKKILKGENK